MEEIGELEEELEQELKKLEKKVGCVFIVVLWRRRVANALIAAA